ncbi:MAG: insulinase family protein [Planctomycetales bacterium]|nr:insulinase family protein [Planctomycetales bacterium]
MTSRIYTHTFDHGLTLLAEPMDWLESAAVSVLLPAGCIYDPPDRFGLANFACDMVQRGCGDMDSRQFLEALERLGVSQHSSVGSAHAHYGAQLVADQLPETLRLLAELVRRPLLPADQIEASRQVCFQELRGVEDSLAQRVFIELYHRLYPDPWGRSCQGDSAGVTAVSIEDVRRHVAAGHVPAGTLISVAGKFAWDDLQTMIDARFGDWPGAVRPALQETPAAGGYQHLQVDSAQTHIAVAYPGVPYRDPDYFQARGAVGVLSDGMSSRLFTEIREKQGLCYSVSASCHSTRDRGSIIAYSATSTERAQQTLDSLLFELRRLVDGVQQDELDRLKAQIKSTLIMQQESSYSRSASIAADMYYLGRVRTIDEISAQIDGLTCDSINAFLSAHPPQDFTIVTLGARPLETPCAIS